MDLLFIFWGFILMMLYFTEFETCRAPSSPLCRTHARIGNSWAEWSTFVNKMKKIVSLFKEKLSTINILNLFSGIFMNKLCNQFGNRIWLFNMRKMPAFGYLTNNCIWQFTVQPLHCIFRQMRSYSICNNSYIWFHAKDKRQKTTKSFTFKHYFSIYLVSRRLSVFSVNPIQFLSESHFSELQ